MEHFVHFFGKLNLVSLPLVVFSVFEIVLHASANILYTLLLQPLFFFYFVEVFLAFELALFESDQESLRCFLAQLIQMVQQIVFRLIEMDVLTAF